MRRKIIIGLGVFTAIIGLITLLITLVYEDQVKSIIISQINNKLKTKVDVRKIEFSIFKNFPDASLSFYDVKAQSVYQGAQKDSCPKNLLEASEISLRFNIQSIFKGLYEIQKIDVKGVSVFIFIDKDNLDNYHCWVEDTLETSSDKVQFKMNRIQIKKSLIDYKDLKNIFHLSAIVNNTKMKGEVFEQDFALLLDGELQIKELQIQHEHYLKDKKVKLNTGILKKNEQYSLTNALVSVEKLNMKVNGTFDTKTMFLEAQGQELDIQSFLSLLPPSIYQKFSDYKSTGLFALTLSVKGKYEKSQIKADFSIDKGTLTNNTGKATLNNIVLKGYFSNGRLQNINTSGIYVTSFYAKLNNNPLSGSFSLIDFEHPFLDGKLNATVDLRNLKDILQLDTFEILEGNAALALRVSTPIHRLQQQKFSSGELGEVSGTLVLKDGKFKFENENTSYENINADLYAHDNYIQVNNLQFSHGKSALNLVGELVNYRALFMDETYGVAQLKAHLNASNLELEDWLRSNQQKNISESNSNDSYLNKIDMKLIAKIDRFGFDKFVATNLSGRVYFNHNTFTLDSLAFNCMDGSVNANSVIVLKPKSGFDLYCNARLSKLNITKLFSQLNNFGQETMTDKHIAGKLTARINYQSSWADLSRVIPESIMADASVSITDGELKNFTPMNKLSRFISLNELSHIKFKELSNNITISNKKIHIPMFQIQSSALNLYCRGEHDFDNNIDYHFKLTLNELLSKKRKKEAIKNSDFNEVEEDKDGKSILFISMTGNIDNPIVKYDKTELKQFVKDEIKNEKQTIKQLLKKDFGLYKKDPTITEPNNKKEPKKSDFKIEWEEDDNTIKKDDNRNIKVNETPTKKTKKKKSEPENSDDYL
ncbi:MAG: hypothetical protein IT238_11680 [Bacteroidia bacterium]|nr:hypothetical protein [Bacteroidia bacterium]MCZ2249499.1 AsmA-like C-terminal region-containing protein [Bacteroidia bacterium]